MFSATSGMRATSAFTNTMAVIMAFTLADRPSPDRLVHGVQWPLVAERHQAFAGLADGVVDLQVLGPPADGAGPLTVDVHETHPVGLQPAQDPLGLLGRRGRCRSRPAQHGVRPGAELGDPLARVGAGRDYPRGREPAVADDVHHPPVILLARGYQLGAPGERPEALRPGHTADERRQ